MKKQFIIFCVLWTICVAAELAIYLIPIKGLESVDAEYDLDAAISLAIAMGGYLYFTILFYVNDDMELRFLNVNIMFMNYFCFLVIFAVSIISRFTIGIVDAILFMAVLVMILFFICTATLGKPKKNF